MIKRINFLNIKFTDTNYANIKKLLNKGGLVVLPSGPGLSSINKDLNYKIALQNSDIVLFDSGYFCILLRFLLHEQLFYLNKIMFYELSQ